MSLNALPDNHILKNDFKIISSLGQGGFGITYLAEDMELGGKVVIKEFLPQSMAARDQSQYTVVSNTAEDELFDHLLKRFREEAQLLNRLRHASIVTVTRLFRENHTAYFVMDFEEGKTLADYLKLHPTFSEEAILSIMMPIFEGTKYVHENGVLHRDIAPDNIYLKTNGMPMLIDFGSARNAIARQSQTLSAIAKDGYSPPEQYTANSDQTAATDIYALGAVMYRMITGHKPANAAQRQMALLNDEPDPIGDLVTNYQDRYSTPLLHAVTKALEIRQKQRFQSISAFQEGITQGVSVTQAQAKYPKSSRVDAIEQIPKEEFSTKQETTFRSIILILIAIAAVVAMVNKNSDPWAEDQWVQDPTPTQTVAVEEPKVKGTQLVPQTTVLEEQNYLVPGYSLEAIVSEKLKVKKDQATAIEPKYTTTIGSLMWQDEPYTGAESKAYNANENSGKVRQWEDAMQYCKDLSLGGYGDWRLPSKKELLDLFQSKDRLKNVVSSYDWTATTYAANTSNAWIVYFYNGDDYNDNKSNSGYVRCVRGGQ